MNAKKLSSVLSLALGLAMLMPAARADMANEETKFTFSSPVQVSQGVVLPAGSYWFSVVDEGSAKHILRITDVDRAVVANVIAATAQTTKPMNDTVVKLAEGPDGMPVLVTWYYAGNKFGHQFLYPTRMTRQMSEQPLRTIIIKSDRPSSRILLAGNLGR